MAEIVTKLSWRKGFAEAAVLLAADEITNDQIADQCGISVRTLYRIQRHPEFQERVAEHVAAFQAAMLRHSIAKRHKRIATLDRLHEKALSVIEERAAKMGDDAPGASTGLMVKSFKQIGAGPDAYAVEEYAVDTALLREIRAIEEQAAKELGQWEEKQAITGEVMVRRYIGVDVEAV